MENIILALIGGLGLFLYGMRLMSDALEKVAGARMRNVLEFFTKTPWRGIFVGTLFTAVIQSSSAVTVMVVSLVNSGLMSLYQAAGVIMGANIGTTVTSQLIAFDLSHLAPLAVMIGVLMLMFCKRQKFCHIGEVFLGFGILFVGLTVMSSSLSTLRELPQITEFLGTLTNPFLAVMVGILVTAVLQNSSAGVGILILLVNQGLLNTGICLFIIMGCNIGSCVSSLLASINRKAEAKRAALFHLLLNLIGTAVIFIVLMIAMEPVMRFLQRISGSNPGRQVANAHTLIKLTEVLIIVPFMRQLIRLTGYFVHEKKTREEKKALVYIGPGSAISPATAVFDATREMERMGRLALENLQRAVGVLLAPNIKTIRTVYETEEQIDHLNKEITDYLVKVNQITLPPEDAKSIGGLFHVVNDIERIGDHAKNIADAASMRLEKEISFSEDASGELERMLEMATEITGLAMEMFSCNNPQMLEQVLELEERVDEMEKRFQESHVLRLTRSECTASAGMIFSDTISGLERVADHATNIALFLQEEDPVSHRKRRA